MYLTNRFSFPRTLVKLNNLMCFVKLNYSLLPQENLTLATKCIEFCSDAFYFHQPGRIKGIHKFTGCTINGHYVS